jgi:short-subunit dehydrogenase
MENTTRGSYGVITGASGGIGFELAEQFGQHGFDLLMVADSGHIGRIVFFAPTI